MSSVIRRGLMFTLKVIRRLLRFAARGDLEQRVLAGLRDRMMAPEMAAEAMRAYAEETNRLNRERRASSEGHRSELAKIHRTLKQMLGVIEEGGHTRGMTERMRETAQGRQENLDADRQRKRGQACYRARCRRAGGTGLGRRRSQSKLC